MTENKKNIYPALILLLIAAFLIFSVWSAYQAAGLGSDVSDINYYSKGLKYNSSQIEKRAAETLGWKITTKLADRGLEFHLTDRVGSGVGKAVGTLYLALPETAENIHLPMREFKPGYYRVNLTDNIRGSIQARLEFERQGARLNRMLLLNL